MRYVVLVVAWCGVAAAQSTTTGAIHGRIVVASTEEVTIVAQREGGGERTVVAATDGTFALTDLVPGAYELAFYLPGKSIARRKVQVAAMATTTLVQKLVPHAPGYAGQATLVEVNEPVEVNDPRVFDRRYLLGVPLPGAGFEGGTAAGGRADRFGLGFHDGTSVDNRLFVDGFDVTGPSLGTAGIALPREFLDGVTVGAPAPSAEYGRATGAQVASVLRPGTNELRGIAFATFQPGALQAGAIRDALPPRTIDVTSELAYDATVGFQLDGPLLRNRMWFSAGIAARAFRIDQIRTIQRRVDADGNGVPDVDPRTGFHAVEKVDSSIRPQLGQSLPIAARLDYAKLHDRLQLSAIAVPGFSEDPALFGTPSTGQRLRSLTTALGGAYTWRPDGEARELHVEAGWYRLATHSGSVNPSFDDTSRTDVIVRSISDFAAHESERVREGCTEGAAARYPLIENCPFTGTLSFGGIGRITDDTERRFALRLAARDRVRAAGEHDVLIGVDADVDASERSVAFSGGSIVEKSGMFRTELKPVLVAAADDDASGFGQCGSFGILDLRCVLATSIDAASRNLAAYARDAWRPRRDVTVEAGLRLEAQQVLYPDDLRNGIQPITGERLGEAAISTHRFAPRGAVSYDFTGEGRGTVFVRAARLVEPVRLAVVERALTRLGSSGRTSLESSIFFRRVTVDPDIQAGYTDEVFAGVQGEPVRDLRLAAWLHHRELGETIEDVVAEDQGGFVVANPGRGEAAHLLRATRTYDALTLVASRRFRRLYALVSYTYARTRGNYTGSVDYDVDNISSNLSRQFDQIELLANRTGLLPQDTPHALKVDATYEQPIGRRGALLFGMRARVLSGAPIAAFDGSERLLLPRGAYGRIDAIHTLDLRAGYRRALSRGTLEVFVDALDASDAQPVASVETRYTLSASQGLSPGADPSDLVFLKSSTEAGQPAARNPRFGHPTSRLTPAALRLGARFTF